MSTSQIRLSVLICTHNRVNDLKETLLVCFQAVQDSGVCCEIIVCPNGCTDGTESIVMELQASHPDCLLKCYPLASAGKSSAFKLGVTEAIGEFILILDDDNSVYAEWIKSCVDTFAENPELGILGCHSKLPDETIPDKFIIQHLANFAVGRQTARLEYAGGSKVCRVWGAGMAFRAYPIKKWFRSGGNFVLPGRVEGNLIAGEDTEICLMYSFWGLKTRPMDILGIIHRVTPSRLTRKNVLRLWQSEGVAFQYYRNYEDHLSLFCSESDGTVRLRIGRVTYELIKGYAIILTAPLILLFSNSDISKRRIHLWRGRNTGIFAVIKNTRSIIAHFQRFKSYERS